MAEHAELEPAPKKSNRLLIVLLIVGGALLFMFLVCLGIVWLIVVPALHKTQLAAQEVITLSQLMDVATAQAHYEINHGWYADSAKILETENLLTSRALAAAFEAHNGNADGPGVADRGYRYRMLQGEGTNVAGWVSGTDPQAGRKLSTWGATAYPETPGSSGENQYYIGEAGVVYKTPMPAANTPPPLEAAPDLPQSPQWQVAR